MTEHFPRGLDLVTYKSYADEERLRQFAEHTGIDINAGVPATGNWEPELAKLENGSTAILVGSYGANYFYSQVDYKDNERLVASRAVRRIPAGSRSKLSYWLQSSPDKELTIHRGKGAFISYDPLAGELQETPIDSQLNPQVTLLSGSFYTLHSDDDARESLVVSSLFTPSVDDWRDIEEEVLPGAMWVRTSEGTVSVPDKFSRFDPIL